MSLFPLHTARALINAAPVPRGKQFAATRLFPLLRQDACVTSGVSPRLAQGLRMQLNLDEYPEYMRYMLPDFDEDDLAACQPYVPDSGICLDCGANTGHWALTLARFVGDTGHVYAFEPLPRFLGRLRENITLNRAGNVTVLDRAVSDRSGVVAIDGDHCRLETDAEQDQPASLNVNCVTISDFVAENRLPRLDFVKMDIEGAELKALRGMEPLFRRGWRPSLCLELHEELCRRLGCSTPEVKEYLADWGYTGFLLHRGKTLPLDMKAEEGLANALFVAR